MKRKNSKTITFDLSLAEYEFLKKVSDRSDMSMTQLIRNMINLELKENKV